ncbi:PspA/IM30 family protein [Bacillus alkalicellulosilyticus]|uniref:PspA/IM30 family protein n=1 Tax=Alkalihalobacterium alkalicellulosilyticum TaxID=1912214 RepID=UPI000998496F|nr:PspA/IM30 family protein [Bacillus alkalicellulosilyticus]
MVFRRIRDLTLASIHEGLDQLENPVTMLNQYMRDVEDEIKKAEKAVLKQVMLGESFKKQLLEVNELIEKRSRQAELALKAGEEELARKALYSKNLYEEKSEKYEKILANNEQELVEIKEQLSDMKQKYIEMKDKKMELVARENAARIKDNLQHTISQFSSEKAEAGFARIEQNIYEMEMKTRTRREFDIEFKESTAVYYDDAITKEIETLKERMSTK